MEPRDSGGIAEPAVCAGVYLRGGGWFLLLAAAELNRLTLELTPVVLAVLLGYSYLKRMTLWSHLVLGLALGLAPTAAWIAVRGSLDPRILVLTGAVTLWVGGFDVLYACQDYEHDRAAGSAQPAAGGGTHGRILGGARYASSHAGAAGVVWLAIRFWRGGLAGHRCRGSAAGL